MESINVLELNKVINILKSFAVSELGLEEIKKSVPSTELDKVNSLLEETDEAISVLKIGGKNPVDTFPNVLETLNRLHAVYCLNPSEILKICRCLFVSRMCRMCIEEAKNGTLLKRYAESLAESKGLENEINRCIESEEEISDNASEELRRIRRQIGLTNERIRDRMNSMIKSQQYVKFLQEPIITIRNGRYTLAVKAEYRGQILGLIHDVSGSGSTLFVEPTAVVEMGNELKKLASEEQKEIERILSSLTAKIAMISDTIYASVLTLSKLDSIFARARLSLEWKAIRPKLNTENRIQIINGRHPLLKADSVIPINFKIGTDYNTLVITGPNTGGKTVTLKTVGLFTLMAECGLFIPADDGTELAVFKNVLSDIGDEQSIEQSLSTFSGHMKSLVGILNRADSNSLVLLDELGAGTDPTEGAALAQSILKYLSESGVTTIATTHYSEVKAFAMTQDNMINASMEFDTEKLAPTYRLLIGIPGRSNAFEISKKLGLKEEIIEYAQTRMHEKDKAFESVLSEAEKIRTEANLIRETVEHDKMESEILLEKIQGEKNRLESEKQRIREKAKEEAREIVRKAKLEMEELVTDIRSSAKNLTDTEKMIQNARDSIRNKETQLASLENRNTEEYVPLKTVSIGQMVYVISMDQKASVIKPQDNKGNVILLCGNMKFTRPISDLAKTEEIDVKQAKKERIELHQKDRSFLELDLRGNTVDDAIMEIDRFIDDANLSSIHEITLIHGKGTGALREGVQQYLKRHPQVKSYRIGAYGEGDAGVTIVTLKG